MLVKMTLQDYPNMKKNQRSSLHRKIHTMAYPKFNELNEKSMSTKDLMNFIGKQNG